MAKLKLAWVSTWNTRCGIATYSEFLISYLPKRVFDIGVFANHLKGNCEDAPNVVRCWTDRNGSLEHLVKNIIDGGYNVAVLQHNFGFYTIEQLGTAVRELEAAGIDTYIFFHKTAEAEINGTTETISSAAKDLKRATRLIVHTVDDVNRLKSYGLIDNVAKLPHGTQSLPPIKHNAIKQLLGVDAFSPIIGCFGFLLPGKGVPELILAFSMLLSKHPTAFLLLLNSQHPTPLSDTERDKCLDLIECLGLRNNVALINDFLDLDEAVLLLTATDCVVFPYQDTNESASGAVRQGLSSLRPVLTTPLSIFEDVAEVVRFLPGQSPVEISNGILQFLEDTEGQKRIMERQSKWLAEHDWSCIGERLANMIVGTYEDRHVVSVTASPTPVNQRQPMAEVADITQRLLNEFRREEFVRMAFHRVVGRDAHLAEIQRYVGLLRDKQLTKAEFLAEICVMDEAKKARAQASLETGDGGDGGRPWMVVLEDLADLDNQEFAKCVYYMLLMRMPDQNELASLVDQLDSNALTRHQAVDRILASDEFVENDLPIRAIGGYQAADDVGKVKASKVT